MSIPVPAGVSLYGLLVAEIARIAARYEPIQLTSDGGFFDRNQVDEAAVGRHGSVFCHNFLSAFEQASFVLWALEIAEPVKQIDAHWQVIRHSPPGQLRAYFQLQHDVDAIAAIAARQASRMFPSLDYVLSTYLDMIEQVSSPFVELAASLKNSSELNSTPELGELVASMLPDGYDGKRDDLPGLIETSAPHLAVLLERAGYLIRGHGRLIWTETAAPALRGDQYALQGGDVTIDDGRPRLRLLN